MTNNAALLDTLLQQAETAVQRHNHCSRLTKQAIRRKLERTDGETVAQQLDTIYHCRPSCLPTSWRVAQQLTFANQQTW